MSSLSIYRQEYICIFILQRYQAVNRYIPANIQCRATIGPLDVYWDSTMVPKMGIVVRKPDFVAGKQQRPRSVCTSAQSVQCLYYSLSGKHKR